MKSYNEEKPRLHPLHNPMAFCKYGGKDTFKKVQDYGMLWKMVSRNF